jgi:hypothetical protein
LAGTLPVHGRWIIMAITKPTVERIEWSTTKYFWPHCFQFRRIASMRGLLRTGAIRRLEQRLLSSAMETLTTSAGYDTTGMAPATGTGVSVNLGRDQVSLHYTGT